MNDPLSGAGAVSGVSSDAQAQIRIPAARSLSIRRAWTDAGVARRLEKPPSLSGFCLGFDLSMGL
jgi:hypothetical protein